MRCSKQSFYSTAISTRMDKSWKHVVGIKFKLKRWLVLVSQTWLKSNKHQLSWGIMIFRDFRIFSWRHQFYSNWGWLNKSHCALCKISGNCICLRISVTKVTGCPKNLRPSTQYWMKMENNTLDIANFIHGSKTII